MVYKYLNWKKIDSDNCADWEPFFRVCMQQPRKESGVFIPVNGELVLNQFLLEDIEANTDWNIVIPACYKKPGTPLMHVAGRGKPLETGQGIFILRRKTIQSNLSLHDNLGCVIEGIDTKVFDAYDNALKYALSPHWRIECSMWQLSRGKFELLHDFCSDFINKD